MNDSLYITILRLLFPPKCIICGELLSFDEREPFCSDCAAKVSFISESEQNGRTEKVISAVYYKPPVTQALLAVKKHENAYQIKHLCALAKNALRKSCSEVKFDVIAVVPSTKKSVREAGFDRMDIFGRKLSRMLKIKYRKSALTKIRETRKQHTLSQSERYDAQKDAFFADSKIVSGKTILLFDDILTTGSTLDECVSVLKRAGASDVYCLTVAATKFYKNSGASLERPLKHAPGHI